MITKKFYKEEDNKWYIELPEYLEQRGEKADLEMVCGADTLLEHLSKMTSEVDVTFSTETFEDCDHVLRKTAEDELGASYIVVSRKMYPLEVWLCPVTKYIFKEYPVTIYFK